jgi:hypothetical protein
MRYRSSSPKANYSHIIGYINLIDTMKSIDAIKSGAAPFCVGLTAMVGSPVFAS